MIINCAERQESTCLCQKLYENAPFNPPFLGVFLATGNCCLTASFRAHRDGQVAVLLPRQAAEEVSQGTGVLSRSWAASISIQRACELPRLVIRPW
jgi:hypothetical protein